jgi:hypothetical protein
MEANTAMLTSSAVDATIPLTTVTAKPSSFTHHYPSKMVKKLQYPQLSPPQKKTKKQGDWWRYMSSDEWKEWQTLKEEFRNIATRCTLLRPCSTRHTVPYP